MRILKEKRIKGILSVHTNEVLDENVILSELGITEEDLESIIELLEKELDILLFDDNIDGLLDLTVSDFINFCLDSEG